jgi:glycosyltransferase involved in cell wall biosynthesis
MRPSLTVALVTSPPSSGSGVTMHVKLLLEQLSNRGHQVFLVSKRTPCAEKLVSIGIQHCWINGDQHNKTLVNALSDIMTMRLFFKTHKITIVHSHHRWLALLARVAATRLNISTIWTDHSDLKEKKIITRYLADYMVSVSESNKNRLSNYFGIPDYKINVIYNTVVPLRRLTNPKICTYRKQFGFDKTAPLIVAVGKVVEGKGFDFIIKALSSLANKYPTIGLAIAGDGELIDKCNDLARQLKINNKVRLLGYVEEIDILINIADIFVSASLSEGMPLNIIEAMSLGKTIIATSVGGVPDIISDRLNGLLVPPADAQALANAVAEVIANPSLAASLGKKAEETYNSLLSLKIIMGKIENLYFKAVS